MKNEILLENRPNFLSDNVLKELVSQIYANNKIKNVTQIYFEFDECIDENVLVYTLSIYCNESATFYKDVKLFSGRDIVIKSMVFKKDENFKPYLYW